ncbi:hypothetical protein BHM03_00039402 [Ensete ventricosum]|uniref:NAC domain-containing protein n=1 Tax=Ensete ventricosum TaxID=4639 RepID=A0A445MK42_ENSVE|nr:hypothetical protein BHM03_00039402 [Ensete ventricosum]
MDEEMTDLFLLKKVCNLLLGILPDFSIPELEVYKKAPWELVVSSSYHPTGVLYCFARVPRSIARDNRLKRKTRGGTRVANGIPHRDRKAAIVKDRADDGDSLAAKAPPLADTQEMSEPSMATPATHDSAVDIPGCYGVHGTGTMEEE